MKCQTCSNELEPNAQFCGNCGNPVVANSNAPATVMTPQPAAPNAEVVTSTPAAPAQPVAPAQPSTPVAIADDASVKATKAQKSTALVGIVTGAIVGLAALGATQAKEEDLKGLDPKFAATILGVFGFIYLVLSVLTLRSSQPKKSLILLSCLAGLSASILLLSLISGQVALLYIPVLVLSANAIRLRKAIK